MVAITRLAIITFLAFLSAAVWAGTATSTSAVASNSLQWQHLKPEQQKALEPLARNWNTLSDTTKRKWISIAKRYPNMTPQEQERLRERMIAWVELTPAEREKARNQYNKLRATPLEERRALEQKWRDYEALSGEEKERLQTARKPTIPATAGSAPLAPKPVVAAPPVRKHPSASAQSTPAAKSTK